MRRLKKNTGLSEAKKYDNDVSETIGEKELNIFMGSRSSLEPEPDSKLLEVMHRPRANKIDCLKIRYSNSFKLLVSM